MKIKKHTLWQWLPFVCISTIMALLVYAAVQQNYRQNANDPQIEVAEEAAALLATGQSPQMFGSNTPTDISQSLSPFIIIYDDAGKAVSGTGTLNGAVPTLPQGVLSAAKAKGEDRFTWQLAPGVRIAAVVAHYNAASPGYVLVGRSLREVEKRESALSFYVLAGWLAMLVLTLIAVAFGSRSKKFSTE